MFPLWSTWCLGKHHPNKQIMLVITRYADGKTLTIPRAPQIPVTREQLMMGDPSSEPTSFISQKQPVKIDVDAGECLTISNKQPFLLYRDGEHHTHNGRLENIQPTDRICFCDEGIKGRNYATFSFRLTHCASDTEEEEVIKRTERHMLQSMENQAGEYVTWDDNDDEVLGSSTSSGWRTKKRKTANFIFAACEERRCGNCKKPGHNRRTCPNRMN